MIRKTYCTLGYVLLSLLSVPITIIFYLYWCSSQYVYFHNVVNAENDEWRDICNRQYFMPNACNNDLHCAWFTGFTDHCTAYHSINIDAINTLLAFAIMETLIEVWVCFGLFSEFFKVGGQKLNQDLSEMKRAPIVPPPALPQQQEGINPDLYFPSDFQNTSARLRWLRMTMFVGWIFNFSYYLWIRYRHDNDAHLSFGLVSLLLRFAFFMFRMMYFAQEESCIHSRQECWEQCSQNWWTCCMLPCLCCCYLVLKDCVSCVFFTCVLCCKNTCGLDCCLDPHSVQHPIPHPNPNPPHPIANPNADVFILPHSLPVVVNPDTNASLISSSLNFSHSSSSTSSSSSCSEHVIVDVESKSISVEDTLVSFLFSSSSSSSTSSSASCSSSTPSSSSTFSSTSSVSCMARTNLCVICLENEFNTVIAPCEHVALCERCAHKILSNPNPLCPTCKQPIAEIRKCFLQSSPP